VVWNVAVYRLGLRHALHMELAIANGIFGHDGNPSSTVRSKVPGKASLFEKKTCHAISLGFHHVATPAKPWLMQAGPARHAA
jgi:hypothetical protein